VSRPKRGADATVALATALGGQRPPKTITQQPFDYDDSHYSRLCALKSGERPKGIDLVNYALDMQYQKDLQKDLFRYLFPICLAAWRDELFGRTSYAGFVEDFYPALVRGRIFERMLSGPELSAVTDYMRGSILDAIDQQRGLRFEGKERRPHKWVRAVTTYGVLLPDLNVLWMRWWNLDSIGKAVSSVQYISCLMYPELANPVFAPWTREEGGGPPTLWEYGGQLYEDRWKPENATFLEHTLTVAYVRTKLTGAVERLAGEPEHSTARRLLDDLSEQLPILESRCVELPRLLATTTSAETLLKWTT
jgi:hypothetical protein